MRVVILQNVARQAVKGVAGDLSCEYEIEIIAPMIRDILRHQGHDVRIMDASYSLWEQLKSERDSLDIVFNLAEAFGGTNSFEPLVPAMLEALHVPFTGANSHTMSLTLDKIVTKRIASNVGVVTPRSTVGYPHSMPDAGHLTFPLIVKPVREEASLGIGPESVVDNVADMQRRVLFVLENYRQPALVEEFIDGREISIGIVGNGAHLHVLPALEFVFDQTAPASERIRSYDYKWGGKKETMVRATLSQDVKELLTSWTLRMFEACECRDYVRLDFRLGAAGPSLLEVNYNPGIGPNTHGLNNTLTMMASFEGMAFEELVVKIFDTAVEREGLRSQSGRSHDRDT